VKNKKKRRAKRHPPLPPQQARDKKPYQDLRESFGRLLAAGAFTAAPTPTALPRGQFQITVATSPSPEDVLATDLRLVKAALLYAGVLNWGVSDRDGPLE
jgi:hypothetical protein